MVCALVWALCGCTGTGTGTATPDITTHDMAREQTLNTVIDMRATRNAR
jgi:hypothetical protein